MAINSGEQAKRRIDHIRDSAGRMSLPPELGNIVAMAPIGDRLYFVAEFGVSSAVLADTIDPDRTNPKIPTFVQQVEFSYGADTPFVQQTICAAISLFNDSYMPKEFDCNVGLTIVLSMSRELASIADTIEELNDSQSAIEMDMKAGKIDSRHIPRTANLVGRCNQGIAHLRSVEQAAAKLAVMLFPKIKANDRWTAPLLKRAAEYFHEGHPCHDTMRDCLRIFQNLADHRNALIHSDDLKWVRVIDYELRPDGKVCAPTIEIAHPDSPMPRMDVRQYFSQQLENAARAFEYFLLIVVEQSNREGHKVFEHHVVQLPDNELQDGTRLAWRTLIKDGQSFP